MRRLFWLGAGIAVGVLVVRKIARTAESYSPAGIADSARTGVSDVVETVREFLDDIRAGMAEREDELLTAIASEGDVRAVLGEDDHR